MVITKISPLSAARVAATLCAATGVLHAFLGAIVSLVGLSLVGLASSPFGPGVALLTGAGIAAVLVLAVSYGLIGFVTTFVAATVYNRLSHVIGGIRVEVAE